MENRTPVVKRPGGAARSRRCLRRLAQQRHCVLRHPPSPGAPRRPPLPGGASRWSGRTLTRLSHLAGHPRRGSGNWPGVRAGGDPVRPTATPASLAGPRARPELAPARCGFRYNDWLTNRSMGRLLASTGRTQQHPSGRESGAKKKGSPKQAQRRITTLNLDGSVEDVDPGCGAPASNNLRNLDLTIPPQQGLGGVQPASSWQWQELSGLRHDLRCKASALRSKVCRPYARQFLGQVGQAGRGCH